jgi:predicted amidohydrolase
MKEYRLCGVQIETEKSPRVNVEKVLRLTREAASFKPDFIVYPEMFETVAKPEDAVRYSHKIPSDFTEEIGACARECGTNLIAGSIFEKEGDCVYNTAVVFDRNGRIIGKYRKMHLFDAFGYGESKGIVKGNEPLVCELDGLRFGVAICYDIRFPEIFRYYALEGVRVVFVPAAFFQPNHDHWVLNVRSRALDNTIYVMACNQTGTRFVGRSMVANPWGISIASMGLEEGFFRTDVDLSLIERTREKLPFLENRRFDVCGKRNCFSMKGNTGRRFLFFLS